MENIENVDIVDESIENEFFDENSENVGGYIGMVAIGIAVAAVGVAAGVAIKNRDKVAAAIENKKEARRVKKIEKQMKKVKKETDKLEALRNGKKAEEK